MFKLLCKPLVVLAVATFACSPAHSFAWLLQPMTIKSLSYDLDDLNQGKRRVTVTVNESNMIFRCVTNDPNYPNTDADGQKMLYALLLSAQSQNARVEFYEENTFSQNAIDRRFIGSTSHDG